MNARRAISRRAFAGGALALALGRHAASAQGFAGLGRNADGFAAVVPGRSFSFPADHGPHPDYRIEWWYLTANLLDAAGAAYGAQWTLFRQASRPGAQPQGWANPQIWMGHAAVTAADFQYFSERLARGGVGQAGVIAKPFHAWIDAWEMRGADESNDLTLAPMLVSASGPKFAYALRLDTDHALVLQGDAGYSQKSPRGQASYYYSQPYFRVAGHLNIADRAIEVTGQAWMDREWSSQPLAPDQSGWDWFSLHLTSGEKLMLFRLRQTEGGNFCSGNWIGLDGKSEQLATTEIHLTPMASTDIAGRTLPTSWRIEIPSHRLNVESTPLNSRSWMGTSFPYWEGPIRFQGSHAGVGYLEMTGY